jgi:hypothetical protein
MTKNLKRRLEAHFAMCAAAAAGTVVCGGARSAQAGIVYSGVMNITIPNDFYGVYLDMVTGATSDGFFKGCDINPYYGGDGLWDAGDSDVVGDTINAFNLALGTLIGPASSYHTVDDFPGTANLLPGVPAYIGIHFFNEGTGVFNYGWVRLTRETGGGTGTIIDWAYEDTGAPIGAGVPAPSALALLSLGALRIGSRRRRA